MFCSLQMCLFISENEYGDWLASTKSALLKVAFNGLGIQKNLHGNTMHATRNNVSDYH